MTLADSVRPLMPPTAPRHPDGDRDVLLGEQGRHRPSGPAEQAPSTASAMPQAAVARA